jgi:RNA ligase (TIGR02306 family)
VSTNQLKEISPCIKCIYKLEVTPENLAKMPNKIREVHNHLDFATYKDKDFTLCPLDGYQSIVSKYIRWACPYMRNTMISKHPIINEVARALVTVQRIKEIEPHTNADRLEIAHILGWKCVVQKGEFHKGELVLYFETDSYIPMYPELEFLRKFSFKPHPDTGVDGLKIKTIKLRGQVSQGLILPLDTFKNIPRTEGADVTEQLKVVKYEVLDKLSIDAKGHFPENIPKTDETRVQLIEDFLKKYAGTLCYVTEKIDGTSCTAYFENGIYGVCSRNNDLKLNKTNLYVYVLSLQKVEEKLRALGKNIALQGEIHGGSPKHIIEGNRLKENGIFWDVYSIFLIDEGMFMEPDEMELFLRENDIRKVPLVAQIYLPTSIDELIKLATRKSAYNSEEWAEGIVIRPLKNIIDSDFAFVRGTNGTGFFSFKVVNPEYLLKHDI